MSISTTPSPKYIGQTLLWGVLCLGLGLWGAYDLWVTIPRREQAFEQYQSASRRLAELNEVRQRHQERGTQPTQQEIDEYNQANAALIAATPGGKAPVEVSKFDKPVQWLYILCLPFVVPVCISLARVLPQRYRLDDDGTLHFKGDREHNSGVWSASEIADIDMSRWMRKSIAWVVRVDSAGGGRVKLDAYQHRDLEKIVGALASRFYPEKWDRDARPVKPSPEEGASGAVMEDSSGSGNGPTESSASLAGLSPSASPESTP